MEIIFLPNFIVYRREEGRGVVRGCAKGARAHPLEKKWLEGITGLKNDPQGRQVFPWQAPPCEIPGYAPARRTFI
jgi:hypothetical protein